MISKCPKCKVKIEKVSKHEEYTKLGAKIYYCPKCNAIVYESNPRYQKQDPIIYPKTWARFRAALTYISRNSEASKKLHNKTNLLNLINENLETPMNFTTGEQCLKLAVECGLINPLETSSGSIYSIVQTSAQTTTYIGKTFEKPWIYIKADNPK